MNIKHYLVLFLWVLCGSTMPATYAVDMYGSWDSTLNIYTESDDNINRGPDAYKLDDKAVGFALTMERDVPFSLNAAFIYSFNVAYKSYSDWDKLNHSQYGLDLEYKFRARQGFAAAIVSLYVKVNAADYDSELRSGNEVTFGASLSKRLTDRTQFVVGLENYQRDADSQVFDISRNRFFGLFDWRIASQTSVYLQYQYLDGDIVSSAAAGGNYDPTNSVLDDAFYFSESDGYNGYGSAPDINIVPAYAYQLDAKTTIWEAGVNVPLTVSQAFQFAVENIKANTGWSNDYSASIARIDYLISF